VRKPDELNRFSFSVAGHVIPHITLTRIEIENLLVEFSRAV
jgi:hypothetical protein